jgi:ketosteroid isomerase-like protein
LLEKTNNTHTQTMTMQTRFRFTLILALAAVSLATAVVFAQPKPEPAVAEEAIKKAVLETNTRMAEAANSMDVDAFFTFIVDTDKCVIVRNGTVFKTRQEAMQAVKRGYMGIAKVDRRFENPQVTVISPEVALLVSEGTVSATLTDGRNLDARFAVSLVFVHRGGQWKVLHGHYSVPARM